MSTNRDFDYENNNVAAYLYNPEEDKCDGIKCKNYIICNTVLPKWWFDCKNCYLCTNCDMMFGILEISSNLECPICLEVKECISQPNCKNHSLCIRCFKRCYYGDENLEYQPIFPYPDIEDEYYDDMDNIKWENYPLIKFYNEEWNKWDDTRIEKYVQEENLRKCPICRK